MGFQSDQFSVTTGTVVQIASIPAGGKGGMVTVNNPSATNGIFVGGSNVSATNGAAVGGPAATAGPNTVTFGPLTGAVYAIASVGTQTITVSVSTIDS